MVNTPYHEPKGTTHFDVKFKSGGLLNQLTAIEVYGLKPAEIEWIYLAEQKRNATPEEKIPLLQPHAKRFSASRDT